MLVAAKVVEEEEEETNGRMIYYRGIRRVIIGRILKRAILMWRLG